METWPSQFTLPDTSFNGDEAANTVRTTMDSGTVRQRRRFSTELLTVKVEWEFSDLEMGIFSAWVAYKINLGCDWFTMSLPLGGQLLQPHTVRFQEGKYSQQYVEVGYWTVSATLEIQSRVMFSEEVLDFYLGIGFNDDQLTQLIAASNAFHTFLHSTYPTLI